MRAIPPARSSAPSRRSGCSKISGRRGHAGPCRPAGADLRLDNDKAKPHGRVSMDKWDGYAARASGFTAAQEDQVAESHRALRRRAHPLGRGSEARLRQPGSDTVAVEFTNSSISSGGDGRESAGWAAIWGDNPHILFHSARRGYIACTATSDDDARGLPDLRRVTVPGQAGAQRRVAGCGSSARPGGPLTEIADC